MSSPNSRRLLRTLHAAWEREPRIDLHHAPLKSALRAGRLCIEGYVGDVAAKRLAGDIARRLAGGVPVDDRIRVRPADKGKQGRLREVFTRSLLEEPVFADHRIRLRREPGMETLRPARDGGGAIDVVIDDGVINLSGRVGSLTHRRLAEVLAWWTGGCEDVLNFLKVQPPEEDNAAELGDAVRLVLEKDPLVHAAQLSVHAHRGSVRLEGYVASREEARLAVMDVWCICGVYEVEDRIQVGR